MRGHFKTFAATLTFIWFSPPSVFAQWVTVDLDTITRVTGEYQTFHQSVAVDDEGTVYAMWRNRIRSERRDQIFFSSKPRDGFWSEPLFIAEFYRIAAMVVNPRTGEQHIFMRDRDNDFNPSHLLYVRKSAAETQADTIAVDSLRASAHSAFIDASGFLHLAWITEVSLRSFRFVYLSNRTGSWQKEIVLGADTGGFTAEGPQIAVAPSGQVHIAYVNPSYGGANAFLVSKSNAQKWQLEQLPFSGNDFGERLVDLAIDSAKGLHVVVSGCEGEDVGGKNFYFFRSPNGTWQGPEELPESLAPISILIQTDRNDMPHIIWEKWAFFASGEIYYSYKDDGGLWRSHLFMDIGLREPVYPSFVIDAEGNGHLLMINYPGISAYTAHVVYLKSKSLTTSVSTQFSESAVPEKFELSPTFPNPFSSSVSVRYRLRTRSETVAQVFCLSGQLVTTIFNAVQQPGEYFVSWNGNDHFGKEVSAGVYFIKLILVNPQGTHSRVAKTLKLN